MYENAAQNAGNSVNLIQMMDRKHVIYVDIVVRGMEKNAGYFGRRRKQVNL